MTKSELLRMFSPLTLFIIHLAYLIVWSKDPFLKKWIDGSFTFFIALVWCNVIRSHIAAKEARSGPAEDAVPPRDEPGGTGTS